MPSGTYRFFYRQSARSAGAGMMIGPPLLTAALFTLFAKVFPAHFWDDWFLWVMLVFFIGIVGIFFVIGLRRVIFGGQWGCFIDDHYMTWTFPRRSGKQDQQVALGEIVRFVVRIVRHGKNMTYSYSIETAAESLPIDIECFGRAKKLGQALRDVEPKVELIIDENGTPRPWNPENVPWFF